MKETLPEKNLRILNEIRKNFPRTTHVYVKRNGPKWEGKPGQTIEIGIDAVLITIGVHPDWEILMSAQQIDYEVEQLFADDPIEKVTEELFEVPAKPSETIPMEGFNIEKPKKRGRPKKITS